MGELEGRLTSRDYATKVLASSPTSWSSDVMGFRSVMTSKSRVLSLVRPVLQLPTTLKTMDLKRVAVAVAVLLVCQTKLTTSLGIYNECSRDTECGPSRYCLTDVGVCERCVPCRRLYNRQPSPEPRSCAKNEFECGVCLQGYQAKELTDQRYSARCNPISVEASDGIATRQWPVVVSVVVAISLLLGLAIIAICYWKRCSVERPFSGPGDELKRQEQPLVINSYSGRPSAPPSYSEVRSHRIEVVGTSVADERLNGAVPIGDHHPGPNESIHRYDDSVDLRPVWDLSSIGDRTEQLVAPAVAPTAGSDTDSHGSNATIPSLWEPQGSDLNLEAPVQQPSAPLQAASVWRPSLMRSRSLDLSGRARPETLGVAMAQQLNAVSVESPFMGLYAGVYIRLSQRRNIPGASPHRNSADSGQSSLPANECVCTGDEEPEAPRAFARDSCPSDSSFSSTSTVSPRLGGDANQSTSSSGSSHIQSDESQRRPQRPPLVRSLSSVTSSSSRDYGFFDSTNLGNRRRASNFEVQLDFSLSIKRRREDF